MYSKKIVYLTRYDRDKQIHILIDAFSKCANEFSDWVVNIYGTEWTRGYRDSLMKKIKSYNLGDRIFLYGRTERPISVLQDASICAFPSKYEGFPLSLTEAMSVGLPCIGFKSCTGVNEIIEDGVNGFLVEDGIDDFSYKLRILMKDKDVCIKFGQYSKRKMMQFNSLKIYNAWESLIINTVNNK